MKVLLYKHNKHSVYFVPSNLTLKYRSEMIIDNPGKENHKEIISEDWQYAPHAFCEIEQVDTASELSHEGLVELLYHLHKQYTGEDL